MTKKLIQALEPRMMLDGAAVATAIDTIDDLANLNKTDLDKKTKENKKEEAEDRLLDLEEKWGKKYPFVLSSWNRNWDRLSNYFQYSYRIRKLIYTTNPVEGFHRQVRKITKTKGNFTADMALLKLVYLAVKNIEQKWTQPLQKWSLTM